MTQFDAIFSALQATGVRYVVVGGVAVKLHGYQRFTKDIDLVIELVPDRALRALEAMTVFQMYSEQSRLSIDVFADYPLDFEELWKHGVELQLAGATPRIASIDHLIRMKRAVGQQQDLLDIEKLEKLQRILDTQGGGPR